MSFLVNDSLAGKRVRCKACQGVLTVPAAAQSPAVTSDSPKTAPAARSAPAKPAAAVPGKSPAVSRTGNLPPKTAPQSPAVSQSSRPPVKSAPKSPAPRTSKPAVPPKPKRAEPSDMPSLDDLAALGEGEIALDDPPPLPPKRMAFSPAAKAPSKTGGWFGSKPKSAAKSASMSTGYYGSSGARVNRAPAESGFKVGVKKIVGGIATLLVVLGIVARITRFALIATGNGSVLNKPLNGPSAPAALPTWTPTSVAATIPLRPTMKTVGLYSVGQTTLTNRIGLSTSVKVYLPLTAKGAKSVPCVMVAPAGSIQIVGMGLADGDDTEQIPYARAGYAVIGYSLSGPIGSDLQKVTDGELKRSAEQFHAADGGVADATAALDFALARFPEIDPARIGCAGHSSAATHALLLSHKESRIKCCAAYAPNIDLNKSMGKAAGEMAPLLPEIESWMRGYSPGNQGAPRCSTFIFNARDDTTVPYEGSTEYAASYPAQIKLVTVASGGHYESMIEQGIPAGIKFFNEKLK